MSAVSFTSSMLHSGSSSQRRCLIPKHSQPVAYLIKAQVKRNNSNVNKSHGNNSYHSSAKGAGVLLNTRTLSQRHWCKGSALAASKTKKVTLYRKSVSVTAEDAAEDSDEVVKSAAQRVERAAKVFRRLGVSSFWCQLVLTVVSTVITVFAILYRTATQASTEVGLYLTLFGLLMGFLSTFWAFGYTRLSAKLRKGVLDPAATPPRTEVIKSLSSGISINMVGLAATLVGLEATCGLLFAKALSFATINQYTMAQANPVQALDIFVVQACTNTLLSHFLGLGFSLWLLKTITSGGADHSAESAAASA